MPGRPKHKLLQPIYMVLAAFLFFVSSFVTIDELTAQPSAQKGVLDLTGFDFTEQPAVSLSGEWEFYWEMLLRSSEMDTLRPAYQEFPRLWNDIPEARPRGYATYRLTVILPEDHGHLALSMPDMYTAYELYVNGDKVSANGEVGRSEESYTPYWSEKIVGIHSDSTDEMELVLQIANFKHFKGGANEIIELGREDYLRSRKSEIYYYGFFMAGCLLMGGLFFLGLYLFGRHDKSILYFSLFCITFSYRMVGFEIYPIHDLLDWPWIVTTRIEYLSMFVSGLFFLEYTRHLYPAEVHDWVINIFSGFSILFTVMGLFLPVDVFARLSTPYTILLPIFIVYATWIYYRAVKKDRPGAGLAFGSTGIIFLLFIYTIFGFYGYLEINLFLNLTGYVAFFFTQSLILSYRFTHHLQMARHRAEYASRAKSQFLSTMSHEIRTPLNAVIGLSGLLSKTELTNEQSEYAKTIRLSGESLLNIINNILDYSKIESGKVDLEMAEVEVLTLIEDVCNLLSPLASEKDLELIYYIENDVPDFIISDPSRIQQILVNLVGNAIKFTDEGKVTIEVKCNRGRARKGNILFEVRDTGIGIPDEKKNELFKSFSQLDSSRTRRHGGTGLGLAICKKLVNVLGGVIWAEGETGEGAAFIFTINAEKAQVDQQYLEEEKDMRGKRAFLLDDNELNLKMTRNTLERAGIEVVSYKSADKLLKGIETLNEYDFGIVDMDLTGRDGAEVASRIREEWNEDQLPMIGLSSIYEISQTDPENLYNLQLTKPVRQSMLLDNIKQVLSGETQPQKTVQSVADAQSKSKDLKILIAEDTIINQRVAFRILERLGYEADIAHDGKEAVDMTRKIPYDLIFMDMNMPIMDGLEATVKLREEEDKLPKSPVIVAMTANAMQEDREKCLKAGMDDFVSKPVTVEMVDEVIEKWFNNK